MNRRRETDPSISRVHNDNNTVRNNDINTVDAVEQNRNKKMKKKKGRRYKSFNPTATHLANSVWGQAKHITPQIDNITVSSLKKQTNLWPTLSHSSTMPRIDSGLRLEMVGRVSRLQQ